MADITRRVAKRAADHIGGEAVEAALLCEAKGTYGLGMITTTVMPRTSTKVLEGRADDTNLATGGMAGSFPGESCVIAVTRSRVIVMPSNGLRFDPPALIIRRGEVAVRSIARKGLGKRVELGFVDGTAVTVDAQRGQPFDRFERLLGSTTDPS